MRYQLYLAVASALTMVSATSMTARFERDTVSLVGYYTSLFLSRNVTYSNYTRRGMVQIVAQINTFCAEKGTLEVEISNLNNQMQIALSAGNTALANALQVALTPLQTRVTVLNTNIAELKSQVSQAVINSYNLAC
jgi:hypothetical protein